MNWLGMLLGAIFSTVVVLVMATIGYGFSGHGGAAWTCFWSAGVLFVIGITTLAVSE